MRYSINESNGISPIRAHRLISASRRRRPSIPRRPVPLGWRPGGSPLALHRVQSSSLHKIRDLLAREDAALGTLRGATFTTSRWVMGVRTSYLRTRRESTIRRASFTVIILHVIQTCICVTHLRRRPVPRNSCMLDRQGVVRSTTETCQ